MAIVRGRPMQKGKSQKKKKTTKRKNEPALYMGRTLKEREQARQKEEKKIRSQIEVIGPQPGPQTTFLSSPADIVIYGGSAGGGKSFGLLLDPLRYTGHKDFGAVIFRRTFPEIKNEGGLWDEAIKLYVPLGARPKETDLSFTFSSGATVSFAHLQHEKNIYSWQGSQVPYLGFDELTHFTSRQFWYLLSRQRNVAGIPNLVRGTCNPDPDSFVRQLIDWWIDMDGIAIPERSGILRYFVRMGDDLIWANSKEELAVRYPSIPARSLTFISAKLADNQILMQKDPGYMSTLLSLPSVDRKRLLDGNWNIRAAAGLYFKRHYFEVVKKTALPPMKKTCRGWDLAATESKTGNSRAVEASHEPAATAGVRIGRGADGFYYIMDLVYDRMSPYQVEQTVKRCAINDGVNTIIRLPQDPGQAGKAQIAHFAKLLAGFRYRSRVMTGDKVTRAGALSSACEHGLVKIVEGRWNETFFNHAEQFPPEVGSPDIIDAAVEAFHELTSGGTNVRRLKPVSVKL